jgi:tetratricopeptide (TPR) repeat protein
MDQPRRRDPKGQRRQFGEDPGRKWGPRSDSERKLGLPPRREPNRTAADRDAREVARARRDHPSAAGPDGVRRGPRRVPDERAAHRPVHLEKDIVRELEATARPGKAEILIKVFGEAAGAFAEGDYRAAIRLAEQSKHMALRATSVRELLGLAYYRSGRWQEAARELAAFRRMSGSAEQTPVLADCHRAVNKPERAVELCDEIDRRRVPRSVFYEGAIVAAGALADMGRIDEAIARLEALDLRPDVASEHHLRAWYVLGDLLERRGRFTQAREWFDAVAAADPDMTDAPERARRLRAHG